MFSCHVCGKTESRQELVSEVFDIDSKPVQVEQIPATVCLHRGQVDRLKGFRLRLQGFRLKGYRLKVRRLRKIG
jgi:YgiT-type zinc finger domain-containing protein